MFFDSLQSQLKTVSDFAALCRKSAQIQGWLHELEGFCLMHLAESGPGEGQVVEIGSFMGRSTFWLATGCRRSGRGNVTAIDHFKGSAEHRKNGIVETGEIVNQGSTYSTFMTNLKRFNLEDCVLTMQTSSMAAAKSWNENIRLLFIDGDHTYPSVREDFLTWSQFVVPSGIIALHDYQNPHFPGVTRFCSELLKGYPQYKTVLHLNHLLVVQKES